MDYVILALATWRASSLIAYENGPYDVFERLRLWAEARHEQLAKLLTCLWCNSVWAGLILTIVYLIEPLLLLPLAMSAGAILVDELVNKVRNGTS